VLGAGVETQIPVLWELMMGLNSVEKNDHHFGARVA
jgi:hypothetical protein